MFKKFLKNHFALKDNVIDKIINAELQKYEFVRRRNIAAITKDLTTIYAKFYTNGDREKAQKILAGDRFMVSNRDLFLVSFLGGASLFLMISTLIVCLLDSNFGKKNKKIMAAVRAFTPICRVEFMIIYIIAATGVVIRVFRFYEINYIHIFELSFEDKITEWQLWRVASVLFFVWTFSFNLNFLLVLNSDPEISTESPAIEVDWISLVTFVCLLLICIQPFFNCFYRAARGELLYTIYQIVIAPFGSVRFRDFFFADILTSMGNPLVDFGYSFCYLFGGEFLTRNGNISSNEGFMFYWTLVFSFLPFWFRFWQCLRRVYTKTNATQLANAGKYLSRFVHPILSYCGVAKKVDTGNNSFWAYFVFYLATNLISIYWDIIIDWGMFMGTKRKTRFIRDQTKFSKKFYYFAMVYNVVARFWWIISIFTISFSG